MARENRTGFVQALGTDMWGAADVTNVRMDTAGDSLRLVPTQPQFATTFAILLHAFMTQQQISYSFEDDRNSPNHLVIVGVRIPNG